MTAIEFLPSGYQLATGGDSNCVNFWDLRKQSKICSLPAHQKLISDIKFEQSTGQGRLMFTTSYDHTLKVFGTKCIFQGENTADEWIPVRTMQGHENKVTSVHVTKDLNRIVTTGFDCCFKLWEAKK